LQINIVALCHLKCFPTSFASKLGLVYVSKSFEWFLKDENNRFLLHLECDAKIVGYCAGFRSSYPGEGSTSGMLQYAMPEAIKGIIRKPYLLFHPELIKRYPLIFKNIRRRIFKTKKNIPVINQNCNESKIGLVVIGVLPEYRGKGCFELLMQRFEEECKKRNADKMILSVKAANARAVAAYKKVGWETSSQTKNGVEMFKMVI
jgi:ribosomal protein S18 acetylase RimI-like enzyme